MEETHSALAQRGGKARRPVHRVYTWFNYLAVAASDLAYTCGMRKGIGGRELIQW